MGISGAGYILTQALTLGFYLVLARLATPDDFGRYAAATVLISIGLLFTESGMLAAIIHRPDRLEAAAATATVSTFVAGIGFALLALAASPLIGHFFHSGSVTAVAAASSGLLFLRAIPIVPTALLQRRFSFARRVVVEPLSVIAFGATAVVATANGLGVWGLLLGYYAYAVADILLSWGLVRWRPRLRLASLAIWRELIGYGRHVFAAVTVLRVGDQIPVALLGRAAGAGPLGQFRYANRLASTPFALILAAASFVLFPALARITEDRERFRSAFVRSLRWMAAIGMPSGFILLALGKPTATLLFGPTWTAAGRAAMALCLWAAAGALISVVSESFKADGRPELLVRMHLLQVGVGALAMASLLHFGLVGVAAGVSVGNVAGAVYALRAAHLVLGVPVRSILREIAPPLLAAIIMAAVVLPVEALFVHAGAQGTALGLLLLAAEAAAGLGLYLGVLHLLAPRHTGEFASLVRLARTRDGVEGQVAEPPSGASVTGALEGPVR